jgi:hemoglobin
VSFINKQESIMQHRFVTAVCLCSMSLLIAAGCGGEQQNKNKEFFTSGNREADQRAEQRMAQQQQLTGDTNNGGTTSTKSQAVLTEQKKPLYDRLGGEVGIRLIIEDFVPRVTDDPRVNWDRLGVKRGGFSIHHNQSEAWDSSADHLKTLKTHLEQFLALATGGPSNYQGKEMKSTHANMHITNPEFDAVLGDLKATLDKLQIANQEQKELLAVVETTRDQIVTER